MKIQPHWRILTIGDGDLSFSHSLAKYHPCKQLVATVYDQESVVREKYANHQFLDALRQKNISVYTGVDIQKPSDYKHTLADHLHQFDAVIFQFPLITGEDAYKAFKHSQKHTSANLLNRILLRSFLINSVKDLLDPQGEQLCFISSKDVKPYIEWDIERSLNLNTHIHYLGKMPFHIEDFPEYQIRNVNRDKFVKDTKSFTYVWSPKADIPDWLVTPNSEHVVNRNGTNELIESETGNNNDREETKVKLTEKRDGKVTAMRNEKITKQNKTDANAHCDICQAGPFTSEKDITIHRATKKHQQLKRYHDDWMSYLEQPRN